MDEYGYKLDNFLLPLISKIVKPNILEFGVENGKSTLKFLNLCRQNNGYLFSVDPVDCSKIIKDSRWSFLQTRDDNFEIVKSKLPAQLDVIFLDSIHEANHVEKIFYEYYKILKIGGYFFIDDISHIPYLKKKKRNNFYCEINNKETYNRILDIYNNNSDLFDLNFAFKSSGLTIIKKNSNEPLRAKKKIKTRENSIKNFVRLLWKNLKRD